MRLPTSWLAAHLVAAREIFYALPRDDVSPFDNPRRDAQIDLGLVTTLF